MNRKDGQDPEEAVLEEIGEVLQAIMKCRRFGYFNRDPTKKKAPTNIETLRREIDDLHNALGCLESVLQTREKLHDIQKD